MLWPKSIPKLVKQTMNYRQRAGEFIFSSLYMKKSRYVDFEAEALGYGLCSNIGIDSNTNIGKYIGDIYFNY